MTGVDNSFEAFMDRAREANREPGTPIVKDLQPGNGTEAEPEPTDLKILGARMFGHE